MIKWRIPIEIANINKLRVLLNFSCNRFWKINICLFNSSLLLRILAVLNVAHIADSRPNVRKLRARRTFNNKVNKPELELDLIHPFNY